jgi:hypothetical protein
MTNNAKTSQFKNGLNFWDKSNVSFSESWVSSSKTGNPGWSMNEELKQKITETFESKAKAIIAETSAQMKVEQASIVSNHSFDPQAEKSSVQNPIKYIDIKQGQHDTMKEAYEEAYIDLYNQFSETSRRTVDFIKVKQKQNEELKELGTKFTEISMTKFTESLLEEHDNIIDCIQTDKREKLELAKAVRKNPPPQFSSSQARDAASLIVFLNEELEDYFSDMCVTDIISKSNLLPKLFDLTDPESIEFQAKTKRFLKTTNVKNLIESEKVPMQEVYFNLAKYIFIDNPSESINKRQHGQSVTTYIERLWTLKEYCKEDKSVIGPKIIETICNDPTNTLNVTDEVMKDFRKELFIHTVSGRTISKEDMLSTTMTIDMLNPVETLDRSNTMALKVNASYQRLAKKKKNK